VCLYRNMEYYSKLMKKLSVILVAGAAAWLHPLRMDAQIPGGLPRPGNPAQSGQTPKSELTRFDLDFAGGTPAALVEAIEHAEGRPLNAIIPEDCAKVPIPALKMSGVTVPELFEALMRASMKSVNYVTGTYFGGINGQASSQYQSMQTSYGFRTEGQITDNSVWYFFHNAPPVPPTQPGSERPYRICRFFQLAPYLETYKIDDITTAIQTGWRMLDDQQPKGIGNGSFGGGVNAIAGDAQKLTFHKDTKLLIAVGEPEKLKLIDSVLEQLALGKTTAGKPSIPAKGGEPAKP
jgi:hypothetical protein